MGDTNCEAYARLLIPGTLASIEMKFYQLKNKDYPWGDYGQILVAGMTVRLPDIEGYLQLERTAPYVPPMIISGLWDLLITDTIKRQIEKFGFKGLEFKKVIKARIVELNWQDWNLSGEEPDFYPETGGPESYILERGHSDLLSDQIGDIYQIIITASGIYDSKGVYQYVIDHGDIMMPKNIGYIIVTERLKLWIEENSGEWIQFKRIEATATNRVDGSASVN